MAIKISLQSFLKDADERVKKAAADVLNEEAQKIENQMLENMNKQGIQERSGNLRRSLKFTEATPEKPYALIKSEVYAVYETGKKKGQKVVVKQPGKRNPAMKGRYRYGVPYGRLLEFSPRLNKPFFYTAWYNTRKETRERIMEKIGNAWSGN